MCHTYDTGSWWPMPQPACVAKQNLPTALAGTDQLRTGLSPQRACVPRWRQAHARCRHFVTILSVSGHSWTRSTPCKQSSKSICIHGLWGLSIVPWDIMPVESVLRDCWAWWFIRLLFGKGLYHQRQMLLDPVLSITGIHACPQGAWRSASAAGRPGHCFAPLSSALPLPYHNPAA